MGLDKRLVNIKSFTEKHDNVSSKNGKNLVLCHFGPVSPKFASTKIFPKIRFCQVTCDFLTLKLAKTKGFSFGEYCEQLDRQTKRLTGRQNVMSHRVAIKI